jgi:hypothetical protein
MLKKKLGSFNQTFFFLSLQFRKFAYKSGVEIWVNVQGAKRAPNTEFLGVQIKNLEPNGLLTLNF